MAVKSLYVGNLPYDTTEEQLRTLFAEYGPVESIRLIGEKGFAFVDIQADKVADAIRAINGRDMNGRALRVDEARPRPPRDGGGGGYGGDRGGGGGGFGGGGGGFGGGGGERGGGGGNRGGGGRGGGRGGRGGGRDRDDSRW